jgi:hypothetical protein
MGGRVDCRCSVDGGRRVQPGARRSVAGRLGALGTPADLKRQFGADSIDEVFVRLARPDAADASPATGPA